MRYSVADDKNIPEDSKSYGVTESGRVYWNRRNRLGQFVSHRGTNVSSRAQKLEAWRCYLESRYQRAVEATRGHLLTKEGERRGVRSDRVVRLGGRYASDELREWLEAEGRCLSYQDFMVA